MKIGLLACSAATLIYFLIVSTMWGEPRFISIPFEILRLLYVPMAITAVCCLAASIVLAVRDGRWILNGFCLLLTLPMIAYVSYRPQYFYMKGYRGDQKQLGEFSQSAGSVLMVVARYEELHPERFHRTGVDDFVVIQGLGSLIRSMNPPLTWSGLDPNQFQDTTDQVTTDGDTIKTPWGSPIQFLMNTDGEFVVHSPDGPQGPTVGIDPWIKKGAKCKIIVAEETDYPAFAQKYFPSSNGRMYVTLNDADYDEFAQTSSAWLLKVIPSN